MPSFYFWDFRSYWTYPPNLVAFALCAALVAWGAVVAAKLSRPASPRG